MKQRKSILIVLAMLILSALLTGCVRMSVDVTIKKNGKADLAMTVAMQEEVLEMSADADSVFEDMDELEGEGWSVKEYREDDYVGFTATRNDAELSDADISDMFAGVDTSDGWLRKEGSMYIMDLPMDTSEDEEIMDYGSEIKAQGGYMVFRVTFPTKPVNHNATSVSADGKTLEWDLLSGQPIGSIHAEFKAGGPNIAVIILAAAIVIALIALVLVLVLHRRNSVDIPEMQTPYGQPFTPQPPRQGTQYGQPFTPQQGQRPYGQPFTPQAPQQGQRPYGQPFAPQAPQQEQRPYGQPFAPQAPQQGQEPFGQPFIPQPPQQEQPQQTREIPPQAAPSPRFCSNCGARLEAGAAFCQHCGQKVRTDRE